MQAKLFQKPLRKRLTKGPPSGIIPFVAASVAHLVERHLAKVEVASSSLVTRSKKEGLTSGQAFFFGILKLFLCSAEVNSACAKVFAPRRKHLYGAPAPPRLAGPLFCGCPLPRMPLVRPSFLVSLSYFYARRKSIPLCTKVPRFLPGPKPPSRREPQTVEKPRVNARRTDDLTSSKSPRQSFSIRGWKNKSNLFFSGT